MLVRREDREGKLGMSYDPGSLTNDTDYNIMLGSSYFERIYRAVRQLSAGGSRRTMPAPGKMNKGRRANTAIPDAEASILIDLD